MCAVPIFAFHSLFIFLCYRTLKSDDSPPLTALNLAILQVFIASLSKLCWNKNTPCRTCGYQMLKSGIYNRSRWENESIFNSSDFQSIFDPNQLWGQSGPDGIINGIGGNTKICFFFKDIRVISQNLHVLRRIFLVMFTALPDGKLLIHHSERSVKGRFASEC